MTQKKWKESLNGYLPGERRVLDPLKIVKVSFFLLFVRNRPKSWARIFPEPRRKSKHGRHAVPRFPRQ